MKNRLFLLSAVTLFLFHTCSNSKKTESKSPLTIHVEDAEVVDRLPIDSVATNLRIIVLETNPNSIFTRANKIYLHNDRIYLMSGRDETLLIFNENGSFIKKISPSGRGPGEYQKLTDFTINTDTEELVLMTNIPYKYLIFGLDGDYKREIVKDHTPFGIIYSDSHFTFIERLFDPSKEASRISTTTDLTADFFINQFPVDPKQYFLMNIGGYTPTTLSSSILFSSAMYDNHIYTINGDKVAAKYFIDFGQHTLPEQYLKQGLDQQASMQQFMSLSKSKYHYYVTAIREYDHYLIFKFNAKNIFIYNKITDTGLKVKHGIQDPHLKSLLEYFPHDGEDSYLMFLLKPGMISHMLNTAKKNPEMYGKKSSDISAYLEKHCRNKEDVEQIMNADENVNPLVILYTIKD